MECPGDPFSLSILFRSYTCVFAAAVEILRRYVKITGIGADSEFDRAGHSINVRIRIIRTKCDIIRDRLFIHTGDLTAVNGGRCVHLDKGNRVGFRRQEAAITGIICLDGFHNTAHVQVFDTVNIFLRIIRISSLKCDRGIRVTIQLQRVGAEGQITGSAAGSEFDGTDRGNIRLRVRIPILHRRCINPAHSCSKTDIAGAQPALIGNSESGFKRFEENRQTGGRIERSVAAVNRLYTIHIRIGEQNFL